MKRKRKRKKKRVMTKGCRVWITRFLQVGSLHRGWRSRRDASHPHDRTTEAETPTKKEPDKKMEKKKGERKWGRGREREKGREEMRKSREMNQNIAGVLEQD